MSNGPTKLEDTTTVSIDPYITETLPKLQTITSAQEVMLLKDRIESQLKEFASYLSSQGVDMQTPLVSRDGYPRADIDVLQVRLARRNINMLRNDLRKVMERMQELLVTYFKTPGSTTTDSSGPNANSKATTRGPAEVGSSEYEVPFAVLREVVSGGPAARAGVKDGDKLLVIGAVNASNHRKLKEVQKEVLEHEDKPLEAVVLRGTERLRLPLTPTRAWDGVGLLGCRITEL